jgi:predicted membrane-bound dolichyl-phosphate-mannose-protein mannosyltransferase
VTKIYSKEEHHIFANCIGPLLRCEMPIALTQFFLDLMIHHINNQKLMSLSARQQIATHTTWCFYGRNQSLYQAKHERTSFIFYVAKLFSVCCVVVGNLILEKNKSNMGRYMMCVISLL